MSNKNNSNISFEELLNKEADQYKIYPSDRVWENLREELHQKTKWPALVIIFVLLIMALSIATVFNYPSEKLNAKFISSIQAENTITKSEFNFVSENLFQNNIKFQSAKTKTDFSKLNNKLKENNDTKISIENEIVILPKEIIEQKQEVASVNSDLSINSMNDIVEENISNSIFTDALVENEKLVINSNSIENLNTFELPSIKKVAIKPKWQIEYYATISNSYRTLSDDKNRWPFISNPVERQALNTNLNDIVRHKPSLGAEVGASVLYKLTNKLYIKGGLQFSVRQYNIDAYRSYGEANINYINNNQLNTYSTSSIYSTNGYGSKANLENKLFQVSIPIGLQWNFIDGERWGVSISATAQPTMALNKNAYIVSTDYNYYTDGTNFFRRFNLNTSSALYFTFKSKNSNWFIGPQVNIQQLPTYNNLYPIKEYRVDYGIKFGITKRLF